jgi:nitrogen fixation protein NifB
VALVSTGGRHPCFHPEARGRYGRVHLPVAPACNLQCGYCRRDFDCANECRPGVASAVLQPEEAVAALERAIASHPSTTVAGIAGPGDAFAGPARTLETLERIRRAHPDLELCVSTNGLAVGAHVGALREVGVRFMTITVNAVDPEVGALVYDEVRLGRQRLSGVEGAALLIERQLEAIALLVAAGITVKVNTVVIPGVNAEHVTEVAQRLAGLGVHRMNAIPLLPVAGTRLAGVPAPDRATLARIRSDAAKHVPQMLHCARCRADAAGRLGGRDTCAGPRTRLVALQPLTSGAR